MNTHLLPVLGFVVCLLAPAIAGAQPESLSTALERYNHEPTAAQVSEWALRSNPARAATEALSRARQAGWLPEVRFRIRRGLGQDASETTLDEAGRQQVSTDDEFTLEGSLRFDLGRLLYARDEPSLLREERARREEQRGQVEQALVYYFERRRLQLERHLLPASTPEARLNREIRILHLTAALDVLTGNRFSSSRRRESRLRESQPRDG